MTSKKRKIFFLFLNVGIIELYKGFACFDVTSNINMFISFDFFLSGTSLQSDRKSQPVDILSSCAKMKL